MSQITCSVLHPRRKGDANFQTEAVFTCQLCFRKRGGPLLPHWCGHSLSLCPTHPPPDPAESCDVTKNGIFVPIAH